MPTPSISDFLKYSNLQMAAEALLYDEALQRMKTGQELLDALKIGNGHASKFTATEATKFAAEWEVVAQKPNTTTGFSGTLFKNNQTGELASALRVRSSIAASTLITLVPVL